MFDPTGGRAAHSVRTSIIRDRNCGVSLDVRVQVGQTLRLGHGLKTHWESGLISDGRKSNITNGDIHPADQGPREPLTATEILGGLTKQPQASYRQ